MTPTCHGIKLIASSLCADAFKAEQRGEAHAYQIVAPTRRYVNTRLWGEFAMDL